DGRLELQLRPKEIQVFKERIGKRTCRGRAVGSRVYAGMENNRSTSRCRPPDTRSYWRKLSCHRDWPPQWLGHEQKEKSSIAHKRQTRRAAKEDKIDGTHNERPTQPSPRAS